MFQRVAIEGDSENTIFRARVSPRRWNGWAVCAFPFSEVARIADMLAEGGYDNHRIHLDDDGVTWIETAWTANHGPSVPELDMPESEIFVDRVTPDSEGCYVIGDGWVWYEIDEFADVIEEEED